MSSSDDGLCMDKSTSFVAEYILIIFYIYNSSIYPLTCT